MDGKNSPSVWLSIHASHYKSWSCRFVNKALRLFLAHFWVLNHSIKEQLNITRNRFENNVNISLLMSIIKHIQHSLHQNCTTSYFSTLSFKQHVHKYYAFHQDEKEINFSKITTKFLRKEGLVHFLTWSNLVWFMKKPMYLQLMQFAPQPVQRFASSFRNATTLSQRSVHLSKNHYQ